MSLPKQVRNQIDEASRLLEPTPNEPPVDTPPVASVDAPDTPEPDTPEQEVVPKDQYLRLEQQLRSLQGIHKSIDRDREQLRANVAALTNKVTELETQLRDKPAAPPPAQSLISPEEITEYTPELLSIIERKAQEVLGPVLAAEKQRADKLEATVNLVNDRNKQLEQLLAGVSAQANEVSLDKFIATIASMMPEWEAVNNDPSFMDWLGTNNPLTSRQYAVDFYAARDRFDANAVVEFFRTYQAATKKGRRNAPPLAQQVTPNSNGGPDRAAPATGKIWTQAEIGQFYKDKANGKYVKDPQRAAALEADIFKAQSENRLAA